MWSLTSRWLQRTNQTDDVVLALIYWGDDDGDDDDVVFIFTTMMMVVFIVVFIFSQLWRRKLHRAGDLWSLLTVLDIKQSRLRPLAFTPGGFNRLDIFNKVLPLIHIYVYWHSRCLTSLDFLRKAFERLGFRVASEFLYSEYKVKMMLLVCNSIQVQVQV